MPFDPFERPALRRRRAAAAAPSAAAAAGLFAAAALVYWLVSRQSQAGIDDRTRQRLMPRQGAAR